MELGIRVGTGRHAFRKELMSLAAEGFDNLSPHILLMLSEMAMELATNNDRIDVIDAENETRGRTPTGSV